MPAHSVRREGDLSKFDRAACLPDICRHGRFSLDQICEAVPLAAAGLVHFFTRRLVGGSVGRMDFANLVATAG